MESAARHAPLTGEVDGVEEGPELDVPDGDLLELLQPHGGIEGPRALFEDGHGGEEGAVGVWGLWG